MLTRRRLAGWQGYAFALLLVAVAGALTLALRGYLQVTPAILLIAATLLGAWFGGLGPGLLASLLTTLFVLGLFVEPSGSLSLAQLDNGVGLLLFMLAMVALTALTSSRRESQREMQQRFTQLDTLHRLSQALSRADSLEEVQAAALAKIKETLEADRAAILLADEAGVMRFRAWTGLSDAYRAAAEGHSPWPPGTADPQPVVVPEVALAPELTALRPLFEAEGIRALAFIPLFHTGQLLGKFMLYYNQPRALRPTELAQAQTIASQLAVAIRQRQATAALRHERERLHITLASIGDAVITTDQAGRITFMNSVAETLTEWPLADALGRPIGEIFNIINEYTRKPADSPVERVLREGVSAGLANHTLLLTRSGQAVPIDDSGAPIRSPEGEQLGAVLVFRDISERQRANRLLETRARQQAVLAALGQRALTLPDLPRLMDEVVARVTETLEVEMGKVLEWQPDGSALRVVNGVGWRPGVVGQALVTTGPESQAGYTLQAYQPVLVTDLRTETRFVGMPLLHEHGVVSGMTVFIPGAQKPFGVLGIHTANRRDFTVDDANFLQAAANVIGAAVERVRIEEALRLARDQNAAILDGIGEGVTVQDAHGRLVYANDVAAQVMGFDTAAALLDAPLPAVLERFELMDENGAPLALSRLPGRLALQGQRPASVTVRFRVRATGAERWSVVSARPIFSADASGQAVYAVNIFHDITDLKRDETHQRVLAQAGGLLANTLDDEGQLSGLAHLLVPHLGDWCAVHVRDETAPGQARLVAMAHVNADVAARTPDYLAALAQAAAGESITARVLRTGQAEHITDVPAALSSLPRDDARVRFAEALGLRSLLIAPFTARGHTLGVLSLGWAEAGREYTPADLALAEEVARRVALTVENARLFAAEREARQAERAARLAAEAAAQSTARLQAVTAGFSEAVTSAQVLDVTLTQGVSALHADGGAIMLLDPAGEFLRVERVVGFAPAAVLPRFAVDDNIPAAEAVRQRAPVWIESQAEFATRYPSLAAQRSTTGHEAAAYVPLLVEGRTLGSLSVSFAAARPFMPDERDYLLALARQCAQAFERAQLYEAERSLRVQEQHARGEAEASRQRLAFLADISSTLSATLDYDSLMQRIAYLLVPYLADYASVYILAEGQRIINVANAHVSLERQRLLEALHKHVRLDLDTPHSLIAQVMRTGQPLLTPEFDWQNQYAQAPEAMRAYVEVLRPASGIMVPLTARGRALGVMVLSLAEGERRFTRTDLGLAEEVARRAALAADNALLFQQSQRLNAELEQRVAERTAELQASNVSLAHEVGERQQAEARLQAFTNELRALTTRLETVREEERTRIAREVHDELGGALTGLKMDLTRLRRQAEAENYDAVLAQAQEMLKLLDGTVKTVRRIATDLRPGVLDDFGLVAAIEWQLQDFQTRAGIACQFNTAVEDLPLPAEAATAMFRIFQETLTNVARHAQATRVEVDLEQLPDGVLLRVSDNGRGIAQPDLFGTKSLGLLGMRERVHLLAGELTIDGAPGEGTRVVVRVPLLPDPGLSTQPQR